MKADFCAIFLYIFGLYLVFESEAAHGGPKRHPEDRQIETVDQSQIQTTSGNKKSKLECHSAGKNDSAYKTIYVDLTNNVANSISDGPIHLDLTFNEGIETSDNDAYSTIDCSALVGEPGLDRQKYRLLNKKYDELGSSNKPKDEFECYFNPDFFEDRDNNTGSFQNWTASNKDLCTQILNRLNEEQNH
jgi:hypothetical protein